MGSTVKATNLMGMLRRHFFDTSGYQKLGLRLDDMLYETPAVTEALRRLPQKLKDDRNYRILRATQLSIQKIILPEKEWTTYEEDRADRILSKLVDEVKVEMKEKEEWNRMH